jgi:hypothetical protein
MYKDLFSLRHEQLWGRHICKNEEAKITFLANEITDQQGSIKLKAGQPHIQMFLAYSTQHCG